MSILIPAAAQTPAVSTAAVATLTPPSSSVGVYLHGIRYSYDGVPTAATLIVSWTTLANVTYTETYYLPNDGANYLPYGGNSQFPKGAVVTITLKAVTGVYGSVYPNAEYR